MVLRSAQFDDVYFSAEDGLGETHHVFIEGNDLPGAWQGGERENKEFVIAETGFGTGLNFLAAWKLFEETAGPGQNLHFISVEKYPLSAGEIRGTLGPLLPSSRRKPGSIGMDQRMGPGFRRDDEEGRYDIYLEQLLSRYGPEGGRFEFSPQVTLELLIGDVNDMLPALEGEVDCWFLDGFKPSANPEMWSETVFQEMVRLSKKGSSFATFTAAGFVKRGLQAAGFDVSKVPGFGSKRDMLVGEFSHD